MKRQGSKITSLFKLSKPVNNSKSSDDTVQESTETIVNQYDPHTTAVIEQLKREDFDFESWEKLLSIQQIVSHKNTFNTFDIDHDGTVSLIELQIAVERISNRKSNQAEVQKMLSKADINNSGDLEFGEFLILMSTVERGNKQYDDLIEAFHVIDVLETAEFYKTIGNQSSGQRRKQKRGIISRQKLMESLTQMGEPLNIDELRDFLEAMGQPIAESELKDFMSKKRVETKTKDSPFKDAAICSYPTFVNAITGRGLLAGDTEEVNETNP